MIALDKLCEIFELAADASLENKSGKLNDLIGIAYRAGIAAVVRALEPVIAKACGQAMSCASPESYQGNKSDAELAEAARQDIQTAATIAKMAINRLLTEGPYKVTLGDTPTGDAGVSGESTVSISPASFCEWEYQRADVNFLTYETGCLSTIRVSAAVLRDVRNCICCKLVYFKMADEP